jgi:hypothetical protein
LLFKTKQTIELTVRSLSEKKVENKLSFCRDHPI